MYRPAPHFTGPYSASGRARRPRRGGISAHRNGSPCPNPFFHAMENFSPDFPRYGKLFSFGFGRGCCAPTSVLFPASGFVVSHARCPQDVDAEDFFRVLAGFHAKIRSEFSDDGASRTTRTGLVSVRCRSQSARAEKARIGFRAAKTRKKSSLSSPFPTPHSLHHSTIPSFQFKTP